MEPTPFPVDASDGTRLAGYRWAAEEPARGVVVIAHGLGEHALRYGHLASALAAAGFDVVAADHRGYGATAATDAELGSFIPAADLSARPRFSRPAPTTTGSPATPPRSTPTSTTRAAASVWIGPASGPSRRRRPASPTRTRWRVSAAASPSTSSRGTDDPVHAGLVWLEKLVARYREAGLEVTVRYYDGGRHEMFNETNRDEVIAGLITWLNCLPALSHAWL